MAILKIKNENGEFINIHSIKGDKGDGIPEGGTAGQVLKKTTDSTEWVDVENLGFIETDPTVPNHVKGITEQDITNWNKKLSYESGSNENGNWVKYDDGRLECYGVLDKTLFLSTTENSQTVQNITIYRSGAPEIIFPHKFIDTNITINITPQTETGTNYSRFAAHRISNVETHQAEIQLLGLESWLEDGIAYQYLNSVHYTAFGRWK